MSLVPKTSTYPACHGIACNSHSLCARWHAVQGSEPDHNTMGTCLEHGSYPEFIAYVPPQRIDRLADLAALDLAAQAGHA